jgi:hypothetical protein
MRSNSTQLPSHHSLLLTIVWLYLGVVAYSVLCYNKTRGVCNMAADDLAEHCAALSHVNYTNFALSLYVLDNIPPNSQLPTPN